MLENNKIILKKIISEIDIGMNFLDNVNLEDFLKTEKLNYATAMVFVNISEFTRRLDHDFKKNNLQIDWREMSDFGEKIIQNYYLIAMDDIYFTVKRDFPELKAQIEKILEAEEE